MPVTQILIHWCWTSAKDHYIMQPEPFYIIMSCCLWTTRGSSPDRLPFHAGSHQPPASKSYMANMHKFLSFFLLQWINASLSPTKIMFYIELFYILHEWVIPNGCIGLVTILWIKSMIFHDCQITIDITISSTTTWLLNNGLKTYQEVGCQ